MNREQLSKYLSMYRVDFDEQKLDLLIEYMKYTLEENEKYNLTAITNEDEFVEKMIFDSALVLSEYDLSNASLIDVGTGSGYPGMVLKILCPSLNLSLIDSTAKKINFIKAFADKHSIKVNAIAGRSEDYCRSHREEFDYATARAVSALPVLIEIIAPLLKVGGQLLALKGLNYETEINSSKNAMDKLSMKVECIREFTLPECNEKRAIIHLRKTKETNKKYPRDYSDIKKRPL